MYSISHFRLRKVSSSALFKDKQLFLKCLIMVNSVKANLFSKDYVKFHTKNTIDLGQKIFIFYKLWFTHSDDDSKKFDI